MSACGAYIVLEEDAEMAYCEREEGHDGDHRVLIEWNDDPAPTGRYEPSAKTPTTEVPNA